MGKESSSREAIVYYTARSIDVDLRALLGCVQSHVGYIPKRSGVSVLYSAREYITIYTAVDTHDSWPCSVWILNTITSWRHSLRASFLKLVWILNRIENISLKHKSYLQEACGFLSIFTLFPLYLNGKDQILISITVDESGVAALRSMELHHQNIESEFRIWRKKQNQQDLKLTWAEDTRVPKRGDKISVKNKTLLSTSLWVKFSNFISCNNLLITIAHGPDEVKGRLSFTLLA